MSGKAESVADDEAPLLDRFDPIRGWQWIELPNDRLLMVEVEACKNCGLVRWDHYCKANKYGEIAHLCPDQDIDNGRAF